MAPPAVAVAIPTRAPATDGFLSGVFRRTSAPLGTAILGCVHAAAYHAQLDVSDLSATVATATAPRHSLPTE